ncbi:MAG TPA: hypothetical protein DCS23_03395 [Candidatus Yonathbacteria bacterium]|nr:hypothetical protein [Candidatus Yonathbacteria bacterium]
MEKDSLTYKAFKNSSYNIMGYLWPIVFTLFITPIIVLTLGVKEYGIYLFINTSAGLFGLFELGLGVAVLKYMSYYYGKKDEEAIKRLTHSANSLFLILGLLSLIISVMIGLFGPSFLPASFLAYEKYFKLFILAGGILFFNIITATYSLILSAIQRFDISNKIGMTSITLSSLGMLFVVKMGGSIREIFIVQLIVAAVFSIIIFQQARKLLPIATFKFGWNKKEIINCYRFGLIAYVNNIATTALSSLDKIVIPFFVGPSNLTYYSMPGNVTAKIPGITNTLTVSMLPTTSQLSGGDEISRMKTMYIRTFRLMIIIAGALTITSISFSYEILKYWLSSDFADRASGVLIILALTNFILALFGPLSNFLLGLGKLKFLSIASVCMAILNAIALFTLLPLYGIVGAAWAYFISVLPVAYLFFYVETRYLNLSNRRSYYKKIITNNIIVAFVMLILNLFIANFIVSLTTLLIAGGTSALTYIALYKLFGFFEPQDWADIERFMELLFKRVKLIPIAREK